MVNPRQGHGTGSTALRIGVECGRSQKKCFCVKLEGPLWKRMTENSREVKGGDGGREIGTGQGWGLD